MSTLYAWAAAALLALAGAVWFKHTLNENADLRAGAKIVQGMLDEAEENTKTEKKRAEIAEREVSKVQAAKDESGKQLRQWKDDYAKLLAGNAQARAWADLDIPPDVARSLPRSSAVPHPNPVPDGGLAPRALPRLPGARPAASPEDGRVSS